ncbi:cytochrome C [Psychromarinibacter sp. C21-152]|uniref:Cytochrome C n=1 Tax=Psychromarinibacter sediminicola TaxID=3033385 RepID=A0AAE3NMT1_9RHOB|nr:cytochrome C [Psychromarinibacter sediminicola]MDF0600798.1 cytochrome C [Psychromarinibacter sediminicola]
MKRIAATCLTASVLAAPALAQDLSEEAAYAADEFRQCATCHVIANEDETLYGRRARTGPNLYCVIGRQAGSVEDFRYSNSLEEAGEAGLVWDEEHMTSYLQDPRAFLRDYLDDSGARSKMTYKVRKDGDRSPEDVAAAFATFLAEVCPEEADADS